MGARKAGSKSRCPFPEGEMGTSARRSECVVGRRWESCRVITWTLHLCMKKSYLKAKASHVIFVTERPDSLHRNLDDL